MGILRWLSDKESACYAGDTSSIPGSGRSPGEGSSNPFQYSCLGNPTDRGTWWATVHRVAKSQTQLSNLACIQLMYFRKLGRKGSFKLNPLSKTKLIFFFTFNLIYINFKIYNCVIKLITVVYVKNIISKNKRQTSRY